MLTRLFAGAAAALVTAVAVVGCNQPRPADPPRRRGADIMLAPDTFSISGRVPRHATLATLLRDQQMRQDVIPTVISVAGRVFDPRRLQADHPFKLVRTVDGLLRHFEYEVDADRFLRIAPPSLTEVGQLTAELVPFEKTWQQASVSGEINESASSLFAAMQAAGERPELSLELADIFGGEIDFNTDLQPGDRFTLAVEKAYREGQFSGYGAVEAAEFRNEGRVLKAIRFTVPGGKAGYYDENGRSLRRFFLASPLKFILAPRVTSRFTSARLHPILRIYRPHFGVDYHAPVGSPVVAVAAGTVVSAGWGGGGGNTVHLRHASGYETTYMHLSSIAVRAGQHVGQGGLVGRVGSTGLSTGPHLDYRVKKDGRPVNPQTLLKSVPPGDPIPAASMARFQAARDRLIARLGAAAPSPVPAVAGGLPAPAAAAGPQR